MPDTAAIGTPEVPASELPEDGRKDGRKDDAGRAGREQDDARPTELLARTDLPLPIPAPPIDGIPVDVVPLDPPDPIGFGAAQTPAPPRSAPEARPAGGTELTGKEAAPALHADQVSVPWLGEPLPSAGAHAAPPAGWGFRSALAIADFPRTGWGHRGYDERAVDDFVERVGHELAAADDQIGDLRLEVDRLHRYIRRQWAAVAAAEAGRGDRAHPGAAPSAQARAVLTQAQELAERRLEDAAGRLAETDRIARARIADAQREVSERLQEADELATRRIREAELAAGRQLHRVETRAEQLLAESEREAARRRLAAEDDHARLLDLARTGYEDIVVRAHRRADAAAELALSQYATGGPTPEQASLEAQAAYLSTFAKATRKALEVALEVSAAEFDRLLGVSASREPAGHRARVIPFPS